MVADKKADDAAAAKKAAAEKAINDSVPQPGEALNPHIKAGSEDDVNSIGTRNIGGRGLGNWYSTDWEIRVGKQYSMEVEKSAHLVTDPVIVEYVNRIGQNLVKNSDAKVPFHHQGDRFRRDQRHGAARRLLLRQLRPDHELR